MYGKVFESIFDSSLAVNGGWMGIYVFSSMIVLADKNGFVNMNARALFERLKLDKQNADQLRADDLWLEFEHAVARLEDPDPDSNIADYDGRRIIPLRDMPEVDGNRGWFIVNYATYRDKASAEEKRKADRERIAAKRAAGKPLQNNDVAKCRKVSQSVADVAYTDTDTDINKQHTNARAREGIPDDWQPGPQQKAYALRFEIPPDELETVVENFKAHHQSAATQSRNHFDDEWRKWITGPITREWVAKLKRAQAQGPPGRTGKPTVIDQLTEAYREHEQRITQKGT